jgi:hypothetical protein
VKAFYEALGQTLELKVVKTAVGISTGCGKRLDIVMGSATSETKKKNYTWSKSNGCRSTIILDTFAPNDRKKMMVINLDRLAP